MSRYVLLALAAACTTESPSATQATATGGLADGQEPTITFASDWNVTVDGTLRAGSPARVHYDLARMTSCKTQSNNIEVWGVTGWAQFDGGTPVSFAVSRLDATHVVPVDAELPLPASATQVAMWFQITDEFGCTAYDSDYGTNFNFPIDHHGLGAVLDFNADWTQTQSAPIHAGDRVVLHYDWNRLAQCYALTNEMPAWGVTAHWQVDGGTVHDVMATRSEGNQLVAADPIVTIPQGHDLALWFEATSVYGCHAWDSAYGANYHFMID